MGNRPRHETRSGDGGFGERKDCSACNHPAGPLNALYLEHVESLVRKMHEFVDLYRCRECGTAYIGISFDAYDDFWAYWVMVSAPEIVALREFESRSDKFWAAVDLVKGKGRHIISPPNGPLEMVDGQASVCAGLAPW